MLREASLVARYWHLRLREVERNLCLRFPLEKLLIRTKSLNINLSDDLCSDAAILKMRWKKAIQLLRTIRNAAYDHRAVHLMSTLERYQNVHFSPDEVNAGASKENEAKIRRIERLINIENMRKPFGIIKTSMMEKRAEGLSKLFVPSCVKNKKVAAKFCDDNGYVSPAQLIAMAQFDKTSVEYETIGTLLDPTGLG